MSMAVCNPFIKIPAIAADKKKCKRTHKLVPQVAAVERYAIPETRQRGYITRAYPSPHQGQELARAIGMGRYLWNWMLSLQETAWAHGVSLSGAAGQVFLNQALTLKLARAKQAASRVLTHPADRLMTSEHWLATCPRSLITQKQRDLKTSWQAFFKKVAERPTFQKRGAKNSFRVQIDPRNYDQEICVHDHQIRAQLGLAPDAVVTPDHRKIAGWVKVPKIGRIRVELTEPVYGRVTMITVRRTQRGKRFKASALEPSSGASDRVPDRWAGFEITLKAKDIPVELDRPKNWQRRVDWEADALSAKGPGSLGAGLGLLDPCGVVGLDMSVPYRALSSNGDVLGRRDRDAFTLDKANQQRLHLKRIQRQISHKEKCRKVKAGFKARAPLPPRNTWTHAQKTAMRQSKRELAGRARLAKVFATLKAQRTHDAQVFTTWLVMHFHTIVVEGLTLRSMGNSLSKSFRRSFNEAAMGEILKILEYKCQLYGRTFVNVGTWFPSSKRCSNPSCHQINTALTLNDRTWICSHCQTVHDRDQNASENMKQEGCRLLGIPYPAPSANDPLKSLPTGESPVSGRRGLNSWLSPVATMPSNLDRTVIRIRSSDPKEASTARGNPGWPCSTPLDRLTMSGTAEGGVRD